MNANEYIIFLIQCIYLHITRHCERSEAIHFINISGLLRANALAMTDIRICNFVSQFIILLNVGTYRILKLIECRP